MNKEEYNNEYKRLKDVISTYHFERIKVEREYDILLRKDDKWVSIIDAINQTQLELDALSVRWYDDNRVYRTGERQLDTRIDGYIMRA